MDILSNVSKRLKDLIEEAGINGSILAKNLDVDHSVISRYLNAERLPSATILVKLADFFQCTTDYILGLSDNLFVQSFKKRPPFNEQLNFLLDYYQMSKYKFTKETNFTEFTVTRWQRGICEPNVESLIKLSKKLKCSVDFVLGREV